MDWAQIQAHWKYFVQAVDITIDSQFHLEAGDYSWANISHSRVMEVDR